MNAQQQANHAWMETFYRDLQDLVDSTFPKTCPKCAKVYPTREVFLTETLAVRNIALEDRSGLFCLEGGPVETSVGLFRNCTCGTTIMANFQDRRDNTVAGSSRRQRFASLMHMLVEKGMSSHEARHELLKVLHGDVSISINELLGDIKLK